MTLSSLLGSWNEFFFKPTKPTPLGLFRIVYGSLMLINLLMLRPEWLVWYGPHGMFPLDTMRQMTLGHRINLFPLLPQTDLAVTAFFWLLLVVTLSVTVGFMTRISTIVLFVCYSSVFERNGFILNSGDTILRIMGFFLMFAPAGAALSVDRLRRIWRGAEGPDVPLVTPWAQRMMQIQTSILYISAFWWKTLGAPWIAGTAVYFPLRVDSIRRFPMPFADSMLLVRLATWGTLVVEFATGVLVWFKDLRYAVLLAALCLHLSIEYALNIPLFQWIMVSTFILFIYPEDLTRAWAWIRGRVAPHLGRPVSVIYDGAVARCTRAADLLQAVDVFGKLRVIDLRSQDTRREYPELAERAERCVLAITQTGVRSGTGILRAIAPLVPLLWPLAPLSLIERRAQATVGAPTPVR